LNFYFWEKVLNIFDDRNEYLFTECLGEKPAIAYSTLIRIAKDIKQLIPNYGIMSSETIYYPSNGEVSHSFICF
jgi:hypothetical protein